MKNILIVKNLSVNSRAKLQQRSLCFLLLQVLLKKQKCAKIEYNERLLKTKEYNLDFR